MRECSTSHRASRSQASKRNGCADTAWCRIWHRDRIWFWGIDQRRGLPTQSQAIRDGTAFSALAPSWRPEAACDWVGCTSGIWVWTFADASALMHDQHRAGVLTTQAASSRRSFQYVVRLASSPGRDLDSFRSTGKSCASAREQAAASAVSPDRSRKVREAATNGRAAIAPKRFANIKPRTVSVIMVNILLDNHAAKIDEAATDLLAHEQRFSSAS